MALRYRCEFVKLHANDPAAKLLPIGSKIIHRAVSITRHTHLPRCGLLPPTIHPCPVRTPSIPIRCLPNLLESLIVLGGWSYRCVRGDISRQTFSYCPMLGRGTRTPRLSCWRSPALRFWPHTPPVFTPSCLRRSQSLLSRNNLWGPSSL